MKGLLIKDFKMIKKIGIIVILISALFFAISILSESSLNFSYYSILLLSAFTINIMGYDEQANWNKYETILPISKTKIVFEKYLLILIMITPAIMIENLILYFNKSINASEIFDWSSSMLLLGIIIPCVILPIIFKVGYLKSRIFKLILIGLTAAIMVTITPIISQYTQTNWIEKLDSSIFIVIAIILLIASFGLSVVLYKKREF